MSVKKLAETVVLQAMEDLYRSDLCNDSIEFFIGDEFDTWADLAGIEPEHKNDILCMVLDIVRLGTRPEETGIRKSEKTTAPCRTTGFLAMTERLTSASPL